MPSKSENFWGRFYFLSGRIFPLDWPEKFCQEFQQWIMSDDPEAAAAYRSPAPLWLCEKNAAGWPPLYLLHQVLTYQECSRLTYPLPATSSVDLLRMQQVDLHSTCYIKWLTYQKCSRLTFPLPVTSSDWPTKNAAGWPTLYLWHQVIDLLRLVARLNCVKTVKWHENFKYESR
jgi:hypothetical protein